MAKPGPKIRLEDAPQDVLADLCEARHKQIGALNEEIVEQRKQIEDLKWELEDAKKHQIVFNTSRDDHHRLMLSWAGKRCTSHDRRCASCNTWDLFDSYWALVSEAAGEVTPEDVKRIEEHGTYRQPKTHKPHVAAIIKRVETEWTCPNCAEHHGVQCPDGLTPAMWLPGTTRCSGCGVEVELVQN